MKVIFTFLVCILAIVCFCFPVNGQSVPLGKGWSIEESITIPVVKIVESTRENVDFDAMLFSGVGGGVALSYSQSYQDITGLVKKVRIFTFSPLTILLQGDYTTDEFLNIAYAFTIGFYNDKLMVGLGHDFGTVAAGQSRWFGMMSVGIMLR